MRRLPSSKGCLKWICLRLLVFAISKYERGDAMPSVEYAKRIADALGISLDYMVSDDDKEEVLDNDTVSRIKDIQKLPDTEKDKIFSVIDVLVRDYKTKQAYAS